jgi:hypothetical protein
MSFQGLVKLSRMNCNSDKAFSCVAEITGIVPSMNDKNSMIALHQNLKLVNLPSIEVPKLGVAKDM